MFNNWNFATLEKGDRIIDIPRAQITLFLKGQPPKIRPFPIKTRVIWFPVYGLPVVARSCQLTFQRATMLRSWLDSPIIFWHYEGMPAGKGLINLPTRSMRIGFLLKNGGIYHCHVNLSGVLTGWLESWPPGSRLSFFEGSTKFQFYCMLGEYS